MAQSDEIQYVYPLIPTNMLRTLVKDLVNLCLLQYEKNLKWIETQRNDPEDDDFEYETEAGEVSPLGCWPLRCS